MLYIVIACQNIPQVKTLDYNNKIMSYKWWLGLTSIVVEKYGALLVNCLSTNLCLC